MLAVVKREYNCSILKIKARISVTAFNCSHCLDCRSITVVYAEMKL